MKATGIVRRIDELGRVVIPKEIRRTLRIKEGDPLEIFVDRGGEVVLKKYSSIVGLTDFAQKYAEALYENLQLVTMICDKDFIVAVAGTSPKNYLNRAISDLVEDAIDQRKKELVSAVATAEIIKGYPEEYAGYIIMPIISDGDAVGALILVARKDSLQHLTPMEEKVAAAAAGFLGRQLEH